MKKQMKEQPTLAYWSFLIAFAFMVTMAARPLIAQDNAQDTVQNQDQQNQTEEQDQDQAQDDNAIQPGPVESHCAVDYTSGSVSFQPGGEGDWVDAVLNCRLTSGDNSMGSIKIRAPNCTLALPRCGLIRKPVLTFYLNDQTTQLRLSSGALIVRVRHLDEGNTLEVVACPTSPLIFRTRAKSD